MYKRNREIENPYLKFVLLSIFFVIGFFFICDGIFPVELKTEHINGNSVAKIHKKAMFPPFKDIYITIPDLKGAIITTSRSSKGGTTYRVELEAYSGYKTPVISYYSSGYTYKQRLQDKINNSIVHKTEFTYTSKQYGKLLFGFIFCFVPLLVMLSHIAKKKSNNNTPQQMPPRYKTQYPAQSFPQKEEDKYKNINDSIIK